VSLLGDYEDGNVFCQIIRHVEPCFKIYEDEATLAFLDIYPQAEGHTLVIPKNVRSRNILDISHEQLGLLTKTVQLVARAVTIGMRSDGVEVQQLNGSAAGQTVFHLHFHVIPRRHGIPVTPHGHAKRASENELRIVSARVRSGLVDVAH